MGLGWGFFSASMGRVRRLRRQLRGLQSDESCGGGVSGSALQGFEDVSVVATCCRFAAEVCRIWGVG